MSLSLLILMLSNILFLIIFAASAYNSNSSCQRKCGKMEIPYPFGIGEGCYLEKWYEIQCLENDTALLIALDKEVVNITLPGGVIADEFDREEEYGVFHMKNPITSKDCTNNQKEEVNLNLTGSPFTLSRDNTLVAFGCDYKAFYTNMKYYMVGCASNCTAAHSLPPSENGVCEGTGCCYVDLPYSFENVFGVKIEANSLTTTTTTVTRRECKVAFLTDVPTDYVRMSLSQPNYSNQLHAKGYSWIEIIWFIDTTNLSFITSLNCIDKTNSISTNHSNATCVYDYYQSPSGYATCTCSSGFTGNPYIPGDCKDYNECLNKTMCPETETCVNLPGHYRCVPKKTILPIVIGLSSGFGVLVLIGGTYCLFKFIKRRRKMNRKRFFFKRNGGLLLQQQLRATDKNVDKTRIFTSKELEKATENFSLNRKLGQGGQGTVYKGMLVDGGIVAVKKSIAIDKDKLEEFINEIVILSQINHRNIVRLLGCCLETEVPILVYEFIPHGNLSEHLHDDLEDSTITTWKMRLRIVVDIAGALSYLHSAASFPIYHRDVKSSNIMLDGKYRAKVSDFGTSRTVSLDHSHLTTVVSGTMGYVDPEYFQSSQFTDKSDVYSFGVLLAELITGEKAISLLRSQEKRALTTYFIAAMKENRLEEIIDARIKDDCDMEQVMAAAKLARSCLNRKGKNRPSMREVSVELEKIYLSETDTEYPQFVVESDEEEQVHIEVDSLNDMGVVDAPSASSLEIANTSFLDAQPQFPRQTW